MRRALGLLVLAPFCALVALAAWVWMVLAFAAGSPRAWTLAKAFDQLGNAMAGGDEDEYFSSRCWRCRADKPYRWLYPAIDWVAAKFGDIDHCRASFEGERAKVSIRSD